MVTRNEEKKKTKKQLIEEAQRAALDGDWDFALTLNDQFLERFPRDAEALNRKGRALIELGELGAARDAYSEALKADPANMIARRNLQRLEMLYNRGDGASGGQDHKARSIPRSSAFIEEVGKTWVDELANPLAAGQLAEIAPGQQLEFQIEDDKIYVVDEDKRLGEIEPSIARRMLELTKAGNRFEVFALGMSGQSLRVILREVYRDPSQAGKIAFPRQSRATQGLMREREALFQRDETDFLFGEDEDEVDEETGSGGTDEDDLDTSEPDNEADAYIDERVVADDEEEDPQ